MSIACIFCKKPCVRDTETASPYHCTNHLHEVIFYVDHKHEHIEWCVVSIVNKDIIYELSWFYFNINWAVETNEFSVTSYKSVDFGRQGNRILHLPYHPPNVTPENAKEKLKVWLAIL